MRIIVGFEKSQVITKALRKKGHEAYSCDIQECSGGHPEWHLKIDVFEAIKAGNMFTQNMNLIHVPKWDGGIFHPECTYLTVTGNKWLKDQPPRKSGVLVGAARREARKEAIEMFMRIVNINIPLKAIENPVGIMSTVYRKPDQIIQPFQFGHPEPKKTCLWLTGLPKLIPTNIVEPEYHTTESGKKVPKWFFYADKSKGQKHRAEIRSKTFPGIAEAIATQWFI